MNIIILLILKIGHIETIYFKYLFPYSTPEHFKIKFIQFLVCSQHLLTKLVLRDDQNSRKPTF